MAPRSAREGCVRSALGGIRDAPTQGMRRTLGAFRGPSVGGNPNMRAKTANPISVEANPVSMQRLRVVAAHRIEELLGELPAVARSARTLLKVLALIIPIFSAGLLFVLWHLATR